MVDRDKEQTQEFKDANKKVVDVGGEKKLLLMDDEDMSGEQELQEMIMALIEEALAGLDLS
jgi:hypothetical protein